MTKRLTILSLLLTMIFIVKAQDEVYFEFDRNNGVPAGAPVEKMERNAAALLMAINRAQSAGSASIDFVGVDITDDAAYSLMLIWENVRMRVLDDDIFQPLVVLRNSKGIRGYEASNIAVEMIPLNDSYKESRNQEITLTFDKQGRISDFVISMGLHQYSTIMKNAKTLDDMDKRMQVLHFVYQFKTAYCQKDKKFMEDIFSDDALIITGRVRQRKTLEGKVTQEVELNKQTKRQYLNNLFKKFNDPKIYINVQFDEIEVEHSPLYPNLYGVTLRQEWNSTGYSDVGTVFLLWDFTNEEAPQIYVRTWQPLADPSGKPLDTHKFKISEFDF